MIKDLLFLYLIHFNFSNFHSILLFFIPIILFILLNFIFISKLPYFKIIILQFFKHYFQYFIIKLYFLTIESLIILFYIINQLLSKVYLLFIKLSVFPKYFIDFILIPFIFFLKNTFYWILFQLLTNVYFFLFHFYKLHLNYHIYFNTLLFKFVSIVFSFINQ